MSQASYLNGYDDGYADARKEFAKAGGSGSGGGTGSEPATRAPSVFTLNSSAGGVRPVSDSVAHVIISSLDATLTTETVVDAYEETYEVFHVSIAPPAGGFVKGDIVMLYLSTDVEIWTHGASVVLDGQDITGFFADSETCTLMTMFDGTSFVRAWSVTMA